MKITDITSPLFLKQLNQGELRSLAEDIRTFLLENISETGGHLSSNLGVVELIIALHCLFDFTKNKLFIDVGHQSYVHKILTGRADKFNTLRRHKGISGFQKLKESVYDHWEAGHAGTALSAALGHAIVNSLDKTSSESVVLIGDASIENGEAFEALNHIGKLKKKVIVILNDNEMAISPNKNSVTKTLGRVRSSDLYLGIKDDVNRFLRKNKVGNLTADQITNFKEILKRNLIRNNYFDDLGFEYYGPVNGHNFKELFSALKFARNQSNPIVIHVKTTKGKGYKLAENDKKGIWHGVDSFDISTGERAIIKEPNCVSWSEAVSYNLYNMAKENSELIVLTPAMIVGSKLEDFFKTYPNQSFDCGIAEEHAATLAASLALHGKRPFLSVYSTFLQRCYDQINHDICRMNLPVVIGVDRTGLVGEDGETHHGLFDIGILRPLPNLIISQPKNYEELSDLLLTAFSSNKPFVVRYPRGLVELNRNYQAQAKIVGKWESYSTGTKPKVIVITYGENVQLVINQANKANLSIIVINALFLKPLDTKLLTKLAKMGLPIFILQSDMTIGGLASAVAEHYQSTHLTVDVTCLGIDDHYVQHGSIDILKSEEGIDIKYLFKKIAILCD